MWYYIAAGCGGFLIGVIVSCILLAKKNLAVAQSITDSVETNVKAGIANAKNNYQAQVDAYENGNSEDSEPEIEADTEPKSEE